MKRFLLPEDYKRLRSQAQAWQTTSYCFTIGCLGIGLAASLVIVGNIYDISPKTIWNIFTKK